MYGYKLESVDLQSIYVKDQAGYVVK